MTKASNRHHFRLTLFCSWISCLVTKMWFLSLLFGAIGGIFIVLCLKILEHRKKERNPEKRKTPEENEERFLD